MAGGLLNLIAIGNQNIILTGNPTKSFFKTKYSKYTNFGLQKYRIDQAGQTELNITKESKFSFKILRYGDLLMDTYLVVKLPNIWSPILNYIDSANNINEFRPYEFKWIKNIGCQIIKEVNISIDGNSIQKFSGHYLQNIVERDFDANKKNIFNKMTGNISELNDPANFNNRNNNYPSVFNYNNFVDPSGLEPSIREFNLYIPINTWFTMSSLMALPLICLQYSELVIDFTLRPIMELYTIKDVLYDNSGNNLINNYNNFPQIQPLQNTLEYQFKRFINPPPTKLLLNNRDDYKDLAVNINSNIHLLCTQCYLDNEERELFAKNTQNYLIKEIYEYNFEKVIKSSKVKIDSNGLVSNWMWYFQRNDVNLRNEWSNYTNWPYENKIPNDLKRLVDVSNHDIYYSQNFTYNIGDISKNIYITGNSPSIYEQSNQREIMKNFAIICDGKYREYDFDSNVFNKIEKYNKSNGSCEKYGLYCYNFSLTTDPFKLQPNGAFNTNKFKTIEFEYNNYNNPPIHETNVRFDTICDPVTGEVIATSKDPTNIYKYYYNLYVIEEKYNILQFSNGFAGLMYSK